jgi:hypothetical protein
VFKRFGPPVLVTLLVLATGIAFVVTERLKLEPPAITSTRVTKQFSPTCRCNTSKARVAFSLRRSEQVTLLIIDSHGKGKEIRQLLDAVDKPSGLLHVIWNGLDNDGQLAPDGNYFVRVYLANKRIWTTLPNTIQLDTQAPKLTSITTSPQTFSPDGDHNRDVLHIGYRLNERARILLYVDGKLVEETKSRAGKAGKFDWAGKSGERLLMGWHNLTLRAIDTVGNESLATMPLPVRIRILKLQPDRIRVAAGATFRLTISTDRASVRWRFNGQIGPAKSRLLELRAPSKPGRYRAIVRSGPYRSSTLVIVR